MRSWVAADGVVEENYLWIDIWLVAMKLSGPRAFRPVAMTVVAIVVAPFFAAIIIATWSGG